jgi:hypothetical protein
MNKTVSAFIPVFLVALLCLEGQDVSEQQAKLEHIRAVNLERAATLPSFVADEIAIRYRSKHTDPPQWEYFDTIESEIAVRGADFTRQKVRLNGKPWTKPTFPNFTWSVDFGAELKSLFDPKCKTAIVFEKKVEALGKPALQYAFRAPADGCFGTFTIKNGMLSARKSYRPPWTGRFVVEDSGGAVVQFQEEAHEFPKGFGAEALTQKITWDYVKIGDGTFLLPVGEEMFGGFVREDLYHVVVEYKNHRHFEASANVTFH